MTGAAPPSWRVYQKEWTVVYTSDATDKEGAAETSRFLAEHYDGRLNDEDIRMSLTVPVLVNGQRPENCEPTHARGSVRTWNLRGEWGLREDADNHVERIWAAEGVVPTVVGAETPQEQELLDYGKRMLPA
jgi:hypothetical protein